MFSHSITTSVPEFFSVKLSDGSCFGFPLSELKRWSFTPPGGPFESQLSIWLGSNISESGIGLMTFKGKRAEEAWEALQHALEEPDYDEDDDEDDSDGDDDGHWWDPLT